MNECVGITKKSVDSPKEFVGKAKVVGILRLFVETQDVCVDYQNKVVGITRKVVDFKIKIVDTA